MLARGRTWWVLSNNKTLIVLVLQLPEWLPDRLPVRFLVCKTRVEFHVTRRTTRGTKRPR